jgi:uncharacterized protein (DUF1800 family)
MNVATRDRACELKPSEPALSPVGPHRPAVRSKGCTPHVNPHVTPHVTSHVTSHVTPRITQPPNRVTSHRWLAVVTGSTVTQILRTPALVLALCMAPAWATAQTVATFTVFNADTNVDIATFTPSGGGVSGTVSIANAPRINIRANANGVQSVVFSDGSITRTENTAPYTYRPTSGAGTTAWAPAVGTYVINAKPYSGRNGTGTAGAAARLTLTLTGSTVPPVATDIPRSDDEAARFLAQATFGPVQADIDRLMRVGYSAWIDEQLAMPRGETHLAFFKKLDAKLRARGGEANDKEVGSAFWKNALTGQDQLRLRMAYALSQIFVISLEDGDVDNYDRAVAAWLDMLNTYSFGNYRVLLEEVSLHPMMGLYLTHIANQKADPITGRVPDENYAREVMQLFSIGLLKLNPDGTPQKDGNGAVLETYTQADVSGLAKVFTGWSWACPAPSDKGCFLRGKSSNGDREDPDRDLKRMVPYENYHSTEAKAFLGKTIEPGITAGASLKAALDHLAAHSNVGPFIGRQLIQRFTTSNPSQRYVADVAATFDNNGRGVRGDLRAVLKAVLLHPEARLVGDTTGKVREPVLRLSAFMRAFAHSSTSGDYAIEIPNNPGLALGQAPLHSPSVFNFYRPGYVAPGTQSAARKLVAPELQIVNETSVAGYVNYMRDGISNGVERLAGSTRQGDLQGDFRAELALANNVPALVDRVAKRLTYGAMSAARRAEIVTAVNDIALVSGSPQQIEAAKRKRVNAAILLTVASPEFVVIK